MTLLKKDRSMALVLSRVFFRRQNDLRVLYVVGTNYDAGFFYMFAYKLTGAKCAN